MVRKFFERTRTLKVDILTFFLSLLTVAFLIIFSFTYFRNYHSILQFSKGVAERSTGTVLANFRAIAVSSERVTKIATGFFPCLGALNPSNPVLLSYMLNEIKYNENFANFYLGFPNGNYIGAYNLSVQKDHHFIKDPSKKLPANARFALRFIDTGVKPSLDTWRYLDADFAEVGHETYISTHFKTTERPWYVGAKTSGTLFWTGYYEFMPSLERGITISNPMYDSQGNLECVIASDLTLRLLSNFLLNQKIGRTGKAVILDQKGEVIAPTTSQTNQPLVSAIYAQYTKNSKNPAFIFKWKGTKYLIYIAKLPVLFGSHWMMMQIVPFKDFFNPLLTTQHEMLGMILIILIVSALIVIYFAKRISSPMVILANEVNKIRELNLTSNVRVASNIKEIILIDTAIDSMRHVVRSFGRYVPKEIVKDLLESQEDIVLGGKKMQITIFFSDIQGFTTIVESYPIDVITPLLEEYFNAMTSIILNTHGTIDKFLGDGIMAFWGAPVSFPDHASKACTCALLCNAMLKKLNQKRKENYLPEFCTRFGINTGTVIVGNIGTEDRMNYTVMGDAVNITSRLQEVDKVYLTSVIISQSTYEELGPEFITRPLDYIAVKGKKEKTKIYELLGKQSSELSSQITEEQILLARKFTEAYHAFERQDWENAHALFTALGEQFPEDYPIKIYLERLAKR